MSFVRIIFLLGAVQAGTHFGCYKENIRKRHFNINPGDFRPELTSVKSCMAVCGTFDFRYTATTSGKFCYCANTLPDISAKEADSNCDMPCIGDSSFMCGGAIHASVYKSSKKITGLTLTSDAVSTIIPVNTPVALDVSIEQGMDVIYSMDYDDGAGRSSPNVTDLLSRTYYIPGEYHLRVYANDQNQTFQDVVAATAVRVDAPAGPLEVICDPVFATHEPGKCTLTAWLGNDLTVIVNVDQFSSTTKMEDPILSLAGPHIKAKEADSDTIAAGRYLMIASEFSQTGKVLGWEMFVNDKGTGTLSLMVLRPACSSTYCYSSNACSAGSCDSTYLPVTSCPSDPFCMQHARCAVSPTCTSPPSRYASSADGYDVIHAVSLTVSDNGYQYSVESGEILVEPGDVLGLDHASGNVVLGLLPAATNEEDKKFSSGAATVGTSFTVAGGTGTGTRLAVRAVASGGAKLHLPYTFTNPGNHTLTATANSVSLPSSPPSSKNIKVRVLEGVNATIIDGPEFAVTGELATFTVLPHTGNDVYYNWTFDSTSFLITTDISKGFTFPGIGVFVVNVTSYNSISQKNNHTWVQVEDRLTNLQVTTVPTILGNPTDISFSMTKGTNFTCTWNYGDSSPTDTSDDTTTPISGSVKQHTYNSKGDYTVTVDCANNVSTISTTLNLKVQEAITNLRFKSEGADKNTDFYLEWQVDSGSEISFELSFDGTPLTTINTVSTYEWKSNVQPGRGPTSVPLKLNASNLVSNATLDVIFEVLSIIVDPTFITYEENTTSHTPVIFTADMASGSGVTVMVEWDDGNSENFTQPPGVEWSTAKNFTHSYLNGGIFDAKATFTNKEGSYSKVATVTVLVGVGSINCVMEDYTLYHPPAYVNLTLEASILPTDPTLYLHWGERQSETLTPSLKLNTPYKHVFGDTGEYLVNATISNLLGSKICAMNLVVVEHLENPTFEQEFPKAAVNLPFDINFCLHRGPSGNLCNLTFDYGDGTSGIYDRQGEGQDGCDLRQVTYTDKSNRVITVTARSPLETESATLNVEVIDGIADSDISVTPPADVDLGNPSVFSATYSGVTQPTLPKVKYIYGDNGNTEEDDGAFSSPASQNHIYASDGEFTATVIVYNEATKVETNVTVGVYTTFTNLKAKAYFLLDYPPGTKQYGGYDGTTDIYAQNKPVFFEVVSDNNAFASSYAVTVTDSNAVATSYTFEEKLFNISFPATDTYQVAITASNPLHSAAIPTPVTVMLLQLVKGFQVTEAASKVKANEPKIFNVQFEDVGTDTCLYIHVKPVDHKEIYSDDLSKCTLAGFSSVAAADKHPLTGMTSFQYTSTTEGYFEVEAIAKNVRSEEKIMIGYSVTGLDCSKPTVNIHDKKPQFTDPKHFKRSDKIQIRGLSTIQCASSFDNQKKWRIEKMDPDYDTVISDVDLTGIEITKAELNLPVRFLDLGLYRVHYEMTMQGEYGSSVFKATAHSYIQIDPSDLIAVMVRGGVSEITRGQAQPSDLQLSPLDYSFDPDLDPLPSPQGLEVQSWTCHLKDQPSDPGNCDVSSATDTLSLDLSSIHINTYHISATVITKSPTDNRLAVTEIFLKVVAGDPPIVTIVPREGGVFYQQSDGFRIPASSRFAMGCMCDNCVADEDVTYRWHIYMDDYRWADNWRILEDSDTGSRVLGRESQEISLEATLFKTFGATIMKIQCDLTRAAAHGGETGSVATKLTVNSPPSGGICTVAPLNRTYSPDKVWTLNIDGWADEDEVAKYQIIIHTSDDEVDRQITSQDVTNIAVQIKANLVEGYSYNNYMEDVILLVYDKLGAVTKHTCARVQVTPMPLGDVLKMMDTVMGDFPSDFSKLTAEGDQVSCTEKATSLVSALNSMIYAGYRMASNNAGSMYGEMDVGRPSYQKTSELLKDDDVGLYNMEYDRDRRSQLRSQVVKSVVGLEAKSPEALIQIGNALNQASEYGDEITIELQGVIVDFVESSLDFMAVEENTDKVSPEQVEAVLTNCAGTVGNIMDSTGGKGGFGTLTELEESKKDPEFVVYDTSSDVEEDEEIKAAKSIDEAIEIKKARTFKKQQAAEATRIRKKMDNIMNKFVQIYNGISVLGQVLEITTLKMKLSLEKTEAQDIAGKKMSIKNSAGGAQFPNITVLPFASKQDPVVISVSQTTNHPLRYSDAAQAISSTTNFIHINVYDNDNTKFNVDGLPEPVKVTIPRDSNTEAPSYIPMNPIIPSWNNIMTFTVDINRTNSAYFMDFADIKDRQFLIIMKMGEVPKIVGNATENVCDHIFLMPPSMEKHKDKEDQNKYRLFLSKKQLNNFTGRVYMGMRELNSTEYDMDISAGCDALPFYANGSDYFKGNFSLRQYVSQCLVIPDDKDDWSTTGCEVSIETDMSNTICLCTHLTTFAGGWVVVPNTIDWSYVFANADFLSNPTIYVTQIVIVVLFILGAVYARLKDKKMDEKIFQILSTVGPNKHASRYQGNETPLVTPPILNFDLRGRLPFFAECMEELVQGKMDKKVILENDPLGLAPLQDNDPKDKYFYEIVVSTGMRRNAGTDSQVCFILSGEDDETDVRAFTDAKRKIFRRGQIDGFLMSVPSCLGYLNFMRIWHDNSGKGKFGSWYLNYVMVRDVQTGEKQVFIGNKWLAVEEDDGQVDRVLPVAGREQLADFSYQFGERTRKNLADGHLWFSVVARPPQSRFTCLQRVCCILCLLYVTMLANAMFYNTTPKEEESNNGFSVGPFSVSPEQIFIGVISNLIVFPVNFLLVFLFRKSRPHHKRPSRIDRAIQEVNEQSNKHTSPNDVKPEVSSIFSVSKSPTIPSDPHRPDTATSRPATVMSMATEDASSKKKSESYYNGTKGRMFRQKELFDFVLKTRGVLFWKTRKKFELPWYFRIVAWILLIVVTLGAGMMVTFYGISFKDETCKKWISSMLISFFMSVFITQPIKVFLFAVILSIIIKNPSEEKEDEEDDEEVHQANSLDNDFLHGAEGEGFGAARPKKVGYKPPDPALLEKYRQKRLKEIKMWAIVREVIVYVFFLWILMVISYRQLGPSNFLYKDTMHRVFIENNDTNIHFHSLRNTEEFWTWAKSGLVNGIRAGSYYNDYPPLKLRSYINDKVSRILGYATMRQLRVRPALCEIPDEMDAVISQCNVGYHILDQEEGSFMPGWVPFTGNETVNSTRHEYTYSEANSLNGYPYWGTLAWYSGGGYVLPLKGSKQDLMDKMDTLEKEGWVDKYTRAIFVEFTVYNAQVNLFAINTIIAEFHPSGGLVQSFRFEPAMLLPYMDSAMLFQLVIQIIYVMFTLFFIYRELREFIRSRFNYFKSFWNLVEIGIIGMSIAAIVIYFYRLFVTLDLTDQFKSTKGNGYVKFQYVGYWNEMLSYMIGFLVFLATLKFLKLLRFNKKITLLSATLHHSARSLLHFSIIYAIVFLAFAQLFYLTYMNIDIAYSTFINSVVASVLMMMGKFNIYTMIMKEPVLTQIFVLLFVVTVTFIMVNMFISILNETFTVVREDINKQGNDYEIVDFMVNSFRKWTGIGGVPANHDVDAEEWNNRQNRPEAMRRGGPDCVDDFPDRIDRLLQSISAVYTDNDNFAKMYKKKPFQSGSMNAKSFLREGKSPSPGPGEPRNRKDSCDAIARVHTH